MGGAEVGMGENEGERPGGMRCGRIKDTGARRSGPAGGPDLTQNPALASWRLRAVGAVP